MKYSSLFTHPSQAPINRAYDEVKSRLNSSPLFTTLHHSSPLFTQVSATTHKGSIRQNQLPSLLFLLEFDEQISLSLLDMREIWTIFCHHLRWHVFLQFFMLSLFFKMFPYGWREVKSGEELRDLFTSPNALFIGDSEEWVKSEEYYFSWNEIPLQMYQITKRMLDFIHQASVYPYLLSKFTTKFHIPTSFESSDKNESFERQEIPVFCSILRIRPIVVRL